MKAFGGFLVAFLFIGMAGFVWQDKNPQLWEWKQNSNVVELNVGTSATSVKAPTFTGDLTGDVTGDVTGNVTGDVVGAISGSTLSGTTLTLTSTIDVGSTVAGIDSFTTTAPTDTVAITGVAVGDFFTITEYCPTWDAVPDTSTFSYQALTNKLVVIRAPANPSGTLKSAAKYVYDRKK